MGRLEEIRGKHEKARARSWAPLGPSFEDIAWLLKIAEAAKEAVRNHEEGAHEYEGCLWELRAAFPPDKETE